MALPRACGDPECGEKPAPATRLGVGAPTPVSVDRIIRQREALISLTSRRCDAAGSLRESLQQITEVAATTLGVERVSVWRYTKAGAVIECADLFEASMGVHSSGTSLSAWTHPGYFTALAEAEVIAAHDAANDSHTREFADDYLVPLGITSMLDAPIAVNGKRLGVVCHEHVGPQRVWTEDEQTFAIAVANIVAALLEADERRQAEQAAQETLTRFNLVVKATNDAVWEWNLLDDSIWWSDGLRALFGHIDIEPGIESWTTRIHPDDRTRVVTHAHEVIESADAYFTAEYRFRRANGTYAVVLDRGFVIRDETGRGLWMIGALQDISERKRADQLIRESARRYRQLFDANPQPMWVYDAETLRFLAVNDAAVAHYGYSRAELLQMTIRDIRPEEDLPRLRDCLASAESGVQYSGLWRHRRKDGSIILVEVTSHRVDFAGRSAKLVLVNDVTARLQAQEQVRAQLDELVRWQRVMLAREDRVQQLKGEVNALLQEGGRAPRYGQAVAPEALASVEDAETAWPPASTSEADRARRALLSVLEDERRTSADLRESEIRFRQLADVVTEVFWIANADATKVLYVSPGYERVWGRSCESLYHATTTWLESIHEEDRMRVTEQARAQRRSGYDLTYRIVRPDGHVRWIQDRAFPIRNDQGEVERIVGVARDMTEQRQLEEQFRQSQKMEAVGQLAGGVAHDFNNILTVMLMQVDVVRDEPTLPEDVRSGLVQIRAAAERAANLTRQLLLFSRRQVMQPADVDLNKVVLSLTRMLQRIIGEDVRLQLDLSSAPLVTFADAGMLDQLLLNLSVNARDAMPDGGRLQIATRALHVDDRQARQAEVAPGRYVSLRVTDAGAGIAPEVLPHIFDPFFTTKEPGKGTGLGLATVFGIVKQHRGWITVDSTPGLGTTFEVCLPASSHAENAADGEMSELAPIGGTETLLVVEDEPYVRALTRGTLTRHGYRVLEAGSGSEALALWRSRPQPIHLLLTDLVMPGGTHGHELARLLRHDDPSLRVIFMSGYSTETAGRALELGSGETFVQKPFAPRQLLTAVRQCLDAS